jgi:predicted permease
MSPAHLTRSLRALGIRLSTLFTRASHDRELEREFESHLQMEIDDRVARGMPPEAARRAALVSAGSIAAAREAYRDRRGFGWLGAAAQDARYGARFLRRSPAFTIAAVMSLALGIGANSAIFSIVNSLLLRTLPVRHPEALVQIFSSGAKVSWTNPLWEALRAHGDLAESAAAISMPQFDLADHGRADVVSGMYGSGRVFEVYGVQPILGRTFTEADDRRGGGPDGAVVVLSEGFWERRFGRDPSVIGRRLNIEHTPFTIIGVTPRSFFGPNLGSSFDLAVPIADEALIRGSQSVLEDRSGWWLRVFARLKPGQTPADLRSALSAINGSVREASLPDASNAYDRAHYLPEPMTVAPASDGGYSYLRQAFRQPLIVVMVVAALVLLISCVNIANLLLARTDARTHELTIRLALGASRGRLVRQLLLESVLVSALGAAVALPFAQTAGAVLVRQLSTYASSVNLTLVLDWRVLGFTAAIAVFVSFLFGTAPALRATRLNANDALRERGRGTSGNARWSAGSVLVAVQLALCLVLVFAAGLFGRTFAKLAGRPLGFDAAHILVVEMSMPKTDTRPDTARLAEFTQVRDAMASVPGVTAATLSVVTPLSDSQWATRMASPPGVTLADDQTLVWVNRVGPGFFSTMGTALEAGRDFNASDVIGAPAGLIANRAFLKLFCPGVAPLACTVHSQADPSPIAVVGLVEDAVYYSMREAPPATIYLPLTKGRGPFTEMSLVVRTSGPAGRLVPGAVNTIATIAPDLIFRVRPISEHISAALTNERIVAMLSGFFGTLALMLAGVGLYGVVSYSVNRRRTEIGIHIALGARPGRVIGLVLSRIAILASVGVASGMLLSLWAAHWVKNLLFGLEPADPSTVAGAAVTLVAVAAIAAGLPAWRSTRIDAAKTLRDI